MRSDIHIQCPRCKIVMDQNPIFQHPSCRFEISHCKNKYGIPFKYIKKNIDKKIKTSSE